MVDSHSHINSREILDMDIIIEMINSLKYLNAVINIGTDYETSKETIDLANYYKKFYSVIGIHPLYDGKIDDIYQLYMKSKNDKIVGIGETGLDKNKDLVEQITNFHESISLANTLELPLVIHSNNANKECIDVLKKHKPKYGFMFHCFQPELDALEQIINMGGYISVGTPITRVNAKKSLEVIQKISIERLLIELDYPFMSDNQQDNGKDVFNKIRQIRKMSFGELNSQLEINTRRLFRKMR